MATARKASKKASKKAAPKKAARKKAAPKKTAVEKLGSYDGYAIHRKGGNVSFGCGDVIVSRADLLTVATAQEHSGFREAVIALKRLIDASARHKSPEEIIRMTPGLLRRIAG